MKFFKTKLNFKGFSHVELSLIIVIILVLSGVGYYVYKHDNAAHAGSGYSRLRDINLAGQIFQDEVCIVAIHGANYTFNSVIIVDRPSGLNTLPSYNPLALLSLNSKPVESKSY